MAVLPAPVQVSADPRALRSNRKLQDALLRLLETQPLEQITIRQIAAEAGVHYATFFRHHPTREALLDHIAAEQIDRLVALTLPILDDRDTEAGFAGLTAYVDEHRTLWTALLTGGAAAAMREELLGISRALAAERAPERSWLPVDLAVICSVSLVVETLAWWLAQPADALSADEVAAILNRLITSSTMQGVDGKSPRPAESAP